MMKAAREGLAKAMPTSLRFWSTASSIDDMRRSVKAIEAATGGGRADEDEGDDEEAAGDGSVLEGDPEDDGDKD